jgi:hypothetical protein
MKCFGERGRDVLRRSCDLQGHTGRGGLATRDAMDLADLRIVGATANCGARGWGPSGITASWQLGGDPDRLQVADCRRCLRIFEWRLLIFCLRKQAASMAEGQQAPVPIESLLMQINADAFCLVRTQFQQIKRGQDCSRPRMLAIVLRLEPPVRVDGGAGV